MLARSSALGLYVTLSADPQPYTVSRVEGRMQGRLTPRRSTLTAHTDPESERPWSAGSFPVTSGGGGRAPQRLCKGTALT